MHIVRTRTDLARLRSTGALARTYLGYVESLFAQVEESSSDGESGFSLDEHGFIVLLEQGDDPRRLPWLGLDPLEHG